MATPKNAIPESSDPGEVILQVSVGGDDYPERLQPDLAQALREQLRLVLTTEIVTDNRACTQLFGRLRTGVDYRKFGAEVKRVLGALRAETGFCIRLVDILRFPTLDEIRPVEKVEGEPQRSVVNDFKGRDGKRRLKTDNDDDRWRMTGRRPTDTQLKIQYNAALKMRGGKPRNLREDAKA